MAGRSGSSRSRTETGESSAFGGAHARRSHDGRGRSAERLTCESAKNAKTWPRGPVVSCSTHRDQCTVETFSVSPRFSRCLRGFRGHCFTGFPGCVAVNAPESTCIFPFPGCEGVITWRDFREHSDLEPTTPGTTTKRQENLNMEPGEGFRRGKVRVGLLGAVAVLLWLWPFVAHAQKTVLRLEKTFPPADSRVVGDYLVHPYDLEFHKGRFFVSDPVAHRISVYGEEGEYLYSIGKRGSGPGELLEPWSITVDRERDLLYCADRGNRKISCYSTSGEFVRDISTFRLNVRDLVAKNGAVYAAAYNEASRSLFAIYDSAGKLFRFFGTLFDPEVNALQYRSILYSGVRLCTYGDSLVAFFTYLPYVRVYDLHGRLVRRARITDSEILEVYRHNLDPAKVVGKREWRTRGWLGGVCLDDGLAYCYWPDGKSVLVFDLQGQLRKRIHLESASKQSNPYDRRLKWKRGSKYVFVNFVRSVVEIYREVPEH